MKAIRTTGILAVLLMLSACGPLINILEVDVRLPATRPLNVLGREMSVFTPKYDSVSVTDSVLLQKFAQSLAETLASEAYLSPGSVPVFSHYTGSEALGTLEQPDYVHRLALETGTNLVFMVDSVEIGGFFTREVTRVEDDYKLQYLMAPFSSVVRVYDAEKVQFIKYIPLRDTVAWEVWVPSETETVSIPSSAFKDLQRASEYFAQELAGSFKDQWETQDRVIELSLALVEQRVGIGVTGAGPTDERDVGVVGVVQVGDGQARQLARVKGGGPIDRPDR